MNENQKALDSIKIHVWNILILLDRPNRMMNWGNIKPWSFVYCPRHN